MDTNPTSSNDVEEYRQWIATMATVVEAAAAGDMEKRVLRCNSFPELKRLADGINRLLDVNDSYVRESGAALDHAAQGLFFRRVLKQGLQGSYGEAVKKINHATEKMAEQADEIQKSIDDRQRLANTFEEDVLCMVTAVSAASTELQATSASQKTAAIQSNEVAENLSAISDEMSAGVKQVIEATQAFTESNTNIMDCAMSSKEVAKRAVSSAEEANKVVTGLSDDSNRIGGVVKIISQVAEQTNLLALNATIEAARAGDLGKGFAVVASEVKNLAKQTAEATQQIEQDIKAVQAATATAVKAIGTITNTTTEMQSVSEKMESLINDQEATNLKIQNEIHATEKNCNSVRSSMDTVTSSANHTNESASQVQEAAAELSKLAEQLDSSVQGFLFEMR